MLAYREWAAQAAGHHPAQRDQARDRPPGVRQGLPPVRHRAPGGPGRSRSPPRSTPSGSTPTSTPTRWPSSGSACNYGYGTVDPIATLSDIALGHGVGLHVDGCLGGFILPFGQELGYDIPVFDYRIPGVTSISADTHKYGYALKGTSVLTFRDKALRNAQYFFLTGLERGQVLLPGHGRLPVGRSARRHLGVDGPAGPGGLPGLRPRPSSRPPPPCRRRCAPIPSCASSGAPTFLFSFTSDEFDIYHVNDFMRERGWRFNGQQYPNALHMAVTRPQTQPGVADTFAADLADGRGLRQEHAAEAPQSGAIYGGVAGGMTDEADDFIKMVMGDMMDAQQAIPADA